MFPLPEGYEWNGVCIVCRAESLTGVPVVQMVAVVHDAELLHRLALDYASMMLAEGRWRLKPQEG